MLLSNKKIWILHISGRLTLKEQRFRILPPADDEDVNSHNDILSKLDDDLQSKSTLKEAKQSPKFSVFYKKHVTSRNISFKFESATMKRVFTMDLCVTRRRLMLFSILCQMKLKLKTLYL